MTSSPSLPVYPNSVDPEAGKVDYAARANWLRAALLGANDGLVSIASLMLGVGAVSETTRDMVASGLAGLVAGALSMAIGEFVSVYAQYDIHKAQIERESFAAEKRLLEGGDEENLPSPSQAAAASALAFAAGGLIPLLGGALVRPWAARVAVVSGLTTLSLLGFGATGAVLGGSPARSSAVRVLIGGWLAMAVTYGVLRLFTFLFAP